MDTRDQTRDCTLAYAAELKTPAPKIDFLIGFQYESLLMCRNAIDFVFCNLTKLIY